MSETGVILSPVKIYMTNKNKEIIKKLIIPIVERDNSELINKL